MILKQKVFCLAKYYLKEQKKYTFKTFRLSSVENTKWWKFFLQTVEKFGNRKEWNVKNFVLSQFAYNEKVLPYELFSDKAWEIFLEYKHRFVNGNVKNIVFSLLDTYNKIKEWSTKQKFDKINFSAFFYDEKIKMFIKRGNYNTYLFTICKHFDKSLMDKNEYSAKRAMIFNNKKILNKMKEILDEEFE